MFPIILILAVAFLILPLVELLCQAPTTDVYTQRTKIAKVIVIVLALIWLIVFLFFPGNNAVLFPHPHGTF
jgi:cytochrome c oxidase assembly protein Cox11